MALIYQGGTHRPEWTEDDLRPYVTHTFADGRTDWFFVLSFFRFTDNWQIAFGTNTVLERQEKRLGGYSTGYLKKEKSLDALNSCIEHYQKQSSENRHSKT